VFRVQDEGTKKSFLNTERRILVAAGVAEEGKPRPRVNCVKEVGKEGGVSRDGRGKTKALPPSERHHLFQQENRENPVFCPHPGHAWLGNSANPGLALKNYFGTLSAVWFSPGRFFSELPEFPQNARPLAFLLLSSLVFAAGNLVYLRERILLKFAILLVNAVFMPFIASAFGYMVMIMMMGKRASYSRLFSVYAYASGATVLLAWLPYSLWFIEIWKWALVGLGLVKGCAFRPFQAAAVIGFSMIILIIFFWSLGPVILWFKGI
jgi:hypothetical protein